MKKKITINFIINIEVHLGFWKAFKMRLAGINALKDSNEALKQAVSEEMAAAIAKATKDTLLEMGYIEEEEEVLH